MVLHAFASRITRQLVPASQPLLPLRQCHVHGCDCVNSPFFGFDNLHQAWFGIVEDRHYVPCMPWMVLHAFASRITRQLGPYRKPLLPNPHTSVYLSLHQSLLGIVEDRHYVPCMPWMKLHAFASRIT
jgi:hypothetical protein